MQGPVPDTSRETIVRAGQPLPPHTDESSTRLHGGLDSTLQVTSKDSGVNYIVVYSGTSQNPKCDSITKTIGGLMISTLSTLSIHITQCNVQKPNSAGGGTFCV